LSQPRRSPADLFCFAGISKSRPRFKVASYESAIANSLPIRHRMTAEMMHIAVRTDGPSVIRGDDARRAARADLSDSAAERRKMFAGFEV